MDDLAALTLRELLTLAREQLGAAASGLKTREELVAALSGTTGAPASPPPAPAEPVVTRDFFRRRDGGRG